MADWYKASSGENANQNNETTETANNGDTNTYSGKTTSEVSTERRASAALGRFQEALKNSSIYSSGGGSASGGGGGGSAGGFDLGGGSSGGEEASSAAWGGAGANKAGEYGGGGAATASRGGGCSGGSCGGGSSTNGAQGSQRNTDQSQSRAVAQSSTIQGLAEQMKGDNDRAILIKAGESWCGPCNRWDSANKSQLESKYGYMQIESSSKLAGELRSATGDGSTIPTFYRVSRGDDGKLKVEHLQTGFQSVNEIVGKMDQAERSGKHYKASEINNPQKQEPGSQEAIKPEQSNPEPIDQQTQSQEHQLELRPVDQRLEITPDKPETADTQQLGICSNGSCSPYTVDFKAENINNEIQRFSDAVSGKDSSSLGIQDFNASNTDPADQEMLAKLGTLISSDMPNENKVASFKEQVSGYQKRHNPAM